MGIGKSSYSILPVLLLCFSLYTDVSTGVDTISGNGSLSGDQTLISSGGNFELGFFNPGNSSNFYICMWYVRVSQRTVVWVANRDAPVSDKYSSQLRISGGNLVLVNGSPTPIWSTNFTSTTRNSLVAVLLDDGNLVLRDGPNSAIPLWESFDFPTHTWLPGAKISYNKRTRKKQLLTSWRNSDDPATGLFSLELDPVGKQYIIRWNGSEQYWTSGSWNGERFSLVPEMRLSYIYNFSYIDSQNESYFTYSVYNPSIISRFVMDVSGQIKLLTWLDTARQWNLFFVLPRTQCEVYALCGANGICQDTNPFCSCVRGFEPRSNSDWNLSDYSGGCRRITPLQSHCSSSNSSSGNGRRDRFWVGNQMVLPVDAHPRTAASSDDCESACFSNCSCTAYAYNSSGCFVWDGELLNLKQTSDGTINIKLAASEFPSSKKSKGIVIGAAVGSVSVVMALLALVLFVFLQWRKRLVGSAKRVEGSLWAFGYKDLQYVTKKFSDKLGGGGFGSVFKGTLPDSTVIAVKKLESISQGEKQFRTEVSTIGTIQHVNLVRLRGFCSEGSKKLLVYDYMKNGSLDSHLFHDNRLLDWKTRYQIALGTARGLFYLHEKCRDCIIHCDIKPENILLDAEFCPKVADFGLAKLVGREFSRVLTTMRGTRGYLAPEWISGVPVTAKADVYSYGMMLFELISGRRNSEQSEDGMVRFFPTWAARVAVKGGDALLLLDRRLAAAADGDEVMRVCRLACWCIQDDESNRPTMGQAVQILEGVLDVNLPPIPRSLQVFVEDQENIVFFTESESGQSSQAMSNPSSGSSRSKNDTPSRSSDS